LKSPSTSEQAAQSGARRQRFQPWVPLAAALLVAVGISTVAYVVGSRPVFVGQLTDATACRWGDPHADLAVGTLLEDGQELELVQGSAVITFASGAKLLLEAPTTVRLNSAMNVHLIDGRLAAKVPRQAIGFAVTSSLARFIDLGTSFTLKLVAEKSFELHVFEGLVEVRLDPRFGEAARRPTRVAEVRALTFDIASGDVANLQFQEGKQMPF
jgi:ferric-dicitrate binding protein FerR (iron transport regulator)